MELRKLLASYLFVKSLFKSYAVPLCFKPTEAEPWWKIWVFGNPHYHHNLVNIPTTLIIVKTGFWMTKSYFQTALPPFALLSAPSRNWPSTSWQSCCLSPTRQRMMPWNPKICPRQRSRMKWGWSCRGLPIRTQPWHPGNAKLAARTSSGRHSHPVSFSITASARPLTLSSKPNLSSLTPTLPKAQLDPALEIEDCKYKIKLWWNYEKHAFGFLLSKLFCSKNTWWTWVVASENTF